MKSKILLIEDDQFLREVYVKLLSEQNYSVNTAANSEEGPKKL